LLCHKTMQGLVADKQFAFNLKAALPSEKLGGENTQGLGRALLAMQQAEQQGSGTDADSDGSKDFAELSSGRDPNSPAADAVLCDVVPLYGCGASVAAPSRPTDALAAAVSALSALAGVLLMRRRRRESTRAKYLAHT
jgi:hypothetical protein